MVISFKKQFVDQIMQGTKGLTIREDKTNRWKPGLAMNMYTGSRFSKTQYRNFENKECSGVQFITLWEDNKSDVQVIIDSKFINDAATLEILAVKDGFINFNAFAEYWLPILQATGNYKWHGKIIHWTDLRF